MAKVTIITLGTRGDVQPYVALGIGLRQAGHDVTVATGGEFGTLVSGHGLRLASLPADFLALMQSAEGKAAVGGDPLRALRVFRHTVLPSLRRVLDGAWAASRDAAAIIYHPKALAGYHVAERLGVPAFLSLPVPALTPTGAFPNPLLPSRSLGGRYNRLTYALLFRLLTLPTRALVNRWRRETLGLARLSVMASELVRDGRPVPTLYPVSPAVVPRPPDWPSTTVLTGFWFLPDAPHWQPPAELAAFLERGPPPMYIGFGSMAWGGPARLTRLVRQAVDRAGQRAVVATGWGGMTGLEQNERCFSIEAAPHGWLFPRVAAVVHHGGAGTTAEGLRAGRPTVVCPLFGDQPFWGRRVRALGVGPRPVPLKQLTAPGLAAALLTVSTDQAMARRADQLGRRIRGEHGVERAVEVIEAAL